MLQYRIFFSRTTEENPILFNCSQGFTQNFDISQTILNIECKKYKNLETKSVTTGPGLPYSKGNENGDFTYFHREKPLRDSYENDQFGHLHYSNFRARFLDTWTDRLKEIGSWSTYKQQHTNMHNCNSKRSQVLLSTLLQMEVPTRVC